MWVIKDDLSGHCHSLFGGHATGIEITFRHLSLISASLEKQDIDLLFADVHHYIGIYSASGQQWMKSKSQ